MQLLMTGEMITAENAHQYGIVNKVVPQQQLLETAREILSLINTKAPIAIKHIIETVNNFDHTQQGYEFEMDKFAECFNTADMKEGVTAFLEKRKPVFKGE